MVTHARTHTHAHTYMHTHMHIAFGCIGTLFLSHNYQYSRPTTSCVTDILTDFVLTVSYSLNCTCSVSMK